MARTLTPDQPRAAIAILAAIVVALWPVALVQVGVIAAAALAGRRLLTVEAVADLDRIEVPLPRRVAPVALALFAALLLGLPILRGVTGSEAVALFDTFFRVGSLVFGGGHVVLPLIEAEVVPHWVSPADFLTGYGAAQAVPGPLFTFAAYLGAVAASAPGGGAGAAIALIAIFLPSFLMMAGALPLWDTLRRRVAFLAALRGVNAAVVGILAAALYDPVFTGAILGPRDFALALAAFGLLQVWRLPPWLVVVSAALAAEALSRL
jgi:chromate transporter